MQEVETIIIGGGVSGLACGMTLHKSKRDFLLITKELGGRMLTSKSHKVNYGASYITADYKNIYPFMGGGKRIKISDCYFFNKGKVTSFYCLRILKSLPQLIKLFFIARDFRLRLNHLRRRALEEQQADILNSDPVLKKYTQQSARSFVKKNRLQDLNNIFFNPLFNSTGFVEYHKSNAFQYLDNLMAVFSRTYVADHSRCCHLMSKDWKKKIKIGAVKDIKRTKDRRFLISASNRKYKVKNIVLALPYKDAKKIHPVPKPAHNIPIYVIEVAGKTLNEYVGKSVIFFRPKDHDITILWKQTTGSDIIFSKIRSPKLRRYYENYKIINEIHWPTACVLSGRRWSKQILGGGLYLASDYNICGLEDAYITGVFAANQIIKSK